MDTPNNEREKFEAFLRDIKFPVLPVWKNGNPHQSYVLENMWLAWSYRDPIFTPVSAPAIRAPLEQPVSVPLVKTKPLDAAEIMDGFEMAMVDAGYHKPERSPFGGEDSYKYERDQDRFVGFQLAVIECTSVSQDSPQAADSVAIPAAETKPVAWCRRDTVLTWEGQRFNAAMMFPSPDGLLDPIPLYVNPADAQRTDAANPIGYMAAYELDRLNSGHDASLRSAKFGPSALDGDVPVFIAGRSASSAQQVMTPISELVMAIEGVIESAIIERERHGYETGSILDDEVKALRAVLEAAQGEKK